MINQLCLSNQAKVNYKFALKSLIIITLIGLLFRPIGSKAACKATMYYTIGTQGYVYFGDSSKVPTARATWKFGDGTIGFGNRSYHTYLTSGNYTVTLIINDTLTSCVDSVSQTVYISFCKADFSYTFSGNTVSFTNQTISTNASTYKWYFGDGTTDTATNAIHLYPSSFRSDNVSLVSNAIGCKDSIIVSIQWCGLQPHFKYTISGDTIQFIDSSYSTNSIPIGYYSWYFTDSNTISHSQNPVKVVNGGGYYDVSLWIFDSTGRCFEGLYDTIFVPGPRACDAWISMYSDLKNGYKMSLGITPNSSNCRIDSVHWDLGDGTTDTARSLVHTYASYRQFYTVKCFYSNKDGCSHYDTLDFYINYSTNLEGYISTGNHTSTDSANVYLISYNIVDSTLQLVSTDRVKLQRDSAYYSFNPPPGNYLV